jgi:hypothetical protein
MAWSYRLNGSASRTATGPMKETADLTCNGNKINNYHDYHPSIPSSYLLHSSIPGINNNNCKYVLHIFETWPIRGGVAINNVYFTFWR